MLAVSDRWDRAVLRSGLRTCRAQVYRGGVDQGVSLNVTGGSLRLDESSNVRRAGTIECADVALMPSEAADLLAVDADLHLSVGITYTEGDTEWVPAGVLRVSRPSRGSLLGGGLSLACADYSSVLLRARFLSPWNVGRWTLVTEVIRGMVQTVLPWVEVVDLTGSQARHPGGSYERDRLAAINELADGIGAVVYFNASGACVIARTPSIAAEPDWVIGHGHRDASLLDASQSLSMDRVYNGVTVTSSNAETPVSGTVVQDSGLLAWGPGRQWPRFYASPVVTTVQQCLGAARSILNRSLAVGMEVAAEVLPNPALEIGDTVLVDLPGMDEPVMRLVSGIDLPIGLGGMSVTLRTEADAREVEGE